MTPTLVDLAQEPRRVAEVTAEAAPALLGELEQLRAVIWARLTAATPAAPSAVEPGRLLTVPEVASILGVPRSYVYELARSGRLPSVRFGKYVRVPPPALHEWLAQHGQKNEFDATLSYLYSPHHDRRRASQAEGADGVDPSRTRHARRRTP